MSFSATRGNSPIAPRRLRPNAQTDHRPHRHDDEPTGRLSILWRGDHWPESSRPSPDVRGATNMTTHGFKTKRRGREHRLRNTNAHRKGSLDTSSFWAAGDKGCSSRRVATLSSGAASTTGVSVESHTPTMTTTTTELRQHTLTNTPSRLRFLESRKLSRFYKAELGGSI